MIKTTWGYDIDADMVEDMLTVDEFNTMTAGKYIGDVRTAPAIKSAQKAVRN